MKKILLLLLSFVLVACSSSSALNVALLKGPTAMGVVHTDLAKSMDLLASPDEMVGKITSKEADVAALPINMASILYNKTGGQIRLLAVNTIGNLFLLGDELEDLNQLEGKKILSAGENASPMYVLNFLLKDLDVDVSYLPSHGDVVAAASEGQADYYVLPEPFVSLFKDKVGETWILDLAEVYKEKTSYPLVMGVVVTTQDKLEEKKKDIEGFLDDYRASVIKVLNEPEASAKLIAEYGIIENADLAQSAIAGSGLAFESPREMKEAIVAYFELLMAENPQSLGGELPGEDFYGDY